MKTISRRAFMSASVLSPVAMSLPALEKVRGNESVLLDEGEADSPDWKRPLEDELFSSGPVRRSDFSGVKLQSAVYSVFPRQRVTRDLLVTMVQRFYHLSWREPQQFRIHPVAMRDIMEFLPADQPVELPATLLGIPLVLSKGLSDLSLYAEWPVDELV